MILALSSNSMVWMSFKVVTMLKSASSHTYIKKIVNHHGWQNEKTANLSIPMRMDSTYLAELELTFVDQMILMKSKHLRKKWDSTTAK
jgi:hypothetical protein